MKISFPIFIESLKNKLDKPLPGLESQLKLASMRRLMKDGQLIIPADARKAGVLILFYPFGGDIYLAFIKRAEYPGVHSGQISFPGGGWERSDNDLVATALREAEEEIGVPRESITPIGKLTDLFIPPSNFLVTPVVGYSERKPEFKIDPEEVDRILEIPLQEFLDHTAIQQKEISIFPDVILKVPCFYVNEQVIWGATAMIMNELLDVISQGS
jgi:8-oxo-dGTP pyrophosphatase MutT (NUDIX family)